MTTYKQKQRGERGDFIRIGITIPPQLLLQLKKLGIEKQCQGEKDTDVSSLLREAITEYLEKHRI